MVEVCYVLDVLRMIVWMNMFGVIWGIVLIIGVMGMVFFVVGVG